MGRKQVKIVSRMNTNTIISEIIALTFLILAPGVFSIILSVCGTIYFVSMLKMNVVDPIYKGSWWKYIKSWITKDK